MTRKKENSSGSLVEKSMFQVTLTLIALCGLSRGGGGGGGGTSGGLAIVQFQFTMEFTNRVGGTIFFYRCTCIINNVKIWPGHEMELSQKLF